jgi:hypothetical protein
MLNISDFLEVEGVKDMREFMSMDTPVYERYGSYREAIKRVPRPVHIVEMAKSLFMLLPMSVFKDGPIAEEWDLAGNRELLEKAGIVKVAHLLGLRDGRWVFLMQRPPGAEKWPTKEASKVLEAM